MAKSMSMHNQYMNMWAFFKLLAQSSPPGSQYHVPKYSAKPSQKK